MGSCPVEQFELSCNEIDGVVVVAPVGEIDIDTAPHLDKELSGQLNRQPPAMIVRLDLVTFLDSMGITVLVKVCKQAAQQKVSLTLAAPSERVRKAFDVTHVNDYIPTHATLQAALADARKAL